MHQNAQKTPAVLNSWKEIADYLHRGVRTVQRWEQELKLPVHRIGSGKRSPVYAVTSELNFWLSTSDVQRPREHPQSLQTPDGLHSSPMTESRRLLSISHELVRMVAENSVRHQRQAEILQQRISEIRTRIK